MQCRSLVRTFLMVFILVGGSWPMSASAGQIDTELESRMQAASVDELIQVVIRPVGTLEGSALKKQVTTQYATRAEQHTATVQALQATAAVTQPAFLSEQVEIWPIAHRSRISVLIRSSAVAKW